jgi:2-polyprenyl-3-methyl-5-hydroxy-6-metoxy-1,4-benzoquinol methylase
VNEKTKNKAIIESIAKVYDVSKDFDLFNTKLASRIICPYCTNKDVLEIGCATGEMTEDLINVSRSLTVIEPSEKYSSLVSQRFGSKIQLYNKYIEDVNDNIVFDAVILGGLLHHLKEPGEFLKSLKRFLKKRGIVLATVPSMTSLHRRIGAKAGLIKDVYDTTRRNMQFDHYGRFDKVSFENLFKNCGYVIAESYGYMLKPFSSEQMMQLKLDWNIINALFEIGKEFEELASQLFIRAKLTKH